MQTLPEVQRLVQSSRLLLSNIIQYEPHAVCDGIIVFGKIEVTVEVVSNQPVFSMSSSSSLPAT